MRFAAGLLGALGVGTAVAGAVVLAAAGAPALAAPTAAPPVTTPMTTPSAAVSAAPSLSPSVAPSGDLGGLFASPSAEASPFTPGSGVDVPILPYLIQLLVVTGVVAGLAYLSLKYVQKKMPGLVVGNATGKQIRLVEKLTIDPRRMVFMVNVGDRYWLMAATETSVTTIAELTKDDLGGQFARLLEQEKHLGENP